MCPLDSDRLTYVCKNETSIASLITKKENFFKKLLELGLFDFVYKIEIPKLGISKDIALLTRGLQWNLMYCVVNFFFDTELQLKPAYIETTVETRKVLSDRLRKRIILISILNVVLLPFIAIFILFYAIFRYGEQFYKDPSTLGIRSIFVLQTTNS